MALAERVDKLTAICSVCGEEAVSMSASRRRPAGPDDLVAANVGGTDLYQARCRRHFAMVGGLSSTSRASDRWPVAGAGWAHARP